MTLSSRFHHPLPDSVQKSTGTEEPIHKSITSPRGTLPFLRPTHAHVHFDNQKLDWNSRDHRKGRHPLEHNKRRRISTILRLEWWNISWWVAFVSPFRFNCWQKLFTLGSAVWVVNGFFVFLPELTTSVELNTTAGGWTAFVGGTLFEIGAYLMVLEALNRKTEVPTLPLLPSIVIKC
jgi:hypothetical protein